MSFAKSYEFTVRTKKSNFNSFVDFANEAATQVNTILTRIQNGAIIVSDPIDIRVNSEPQDRGYGDYYSHIVIIFNYDAEKRVTIDDSEIIRKELFKNSMWYAPEDNEGIRICKRYQ
ncbi:hypothetical protein ACW5XW_23930 [Aeromonas piscicola]|uniref:hypothetical protein n=1 Tax=Aeromonas TaxID=642 RepID=UPI0012E0A6F0|nr:MULTISPECIES: hypothetical protein [Aeromonas]MDM5128642.1 hypothetical protein [Aeromonas salmonicida]